MSRYRSQGRVVITDLGARKRLPRSSWPVSAGGTGRQPQTFEFTSGDWVAASDLHYVTATHYIGTKSILFQCYDQDGTDVTGIVEKAIRTTSTLAVYMDADYTPTRLYVVVL